MVDIVDFCTSDLCPFDGTNAVSTLDGLAHAIHEHEELEFFIVGIGYTGSVRPGMAILSQCLLQLEGMVTRHERLGRFGYDRCIPV
jgi:hypothetical protein